jgi:fatty-acyl-CoA synthase
MIAPFSRTYYDLLREQAALHPDALAVICGDREASFASLAATAGRVASALRERGVGRGDRVGLIVNNRLEWMEVCFAASALGAVTTPISTWSTQRELGFILSDSKIGILFTLSGYARQDFAGSLRNLVPESVDGRPGAWRSAAFPALRHIVAFDGEPASGWSRYEEFVAKRDPIGPLPPGQGASANDDLLLMYTSGTSARPKAARMVNYGVIENGFNIGERQNLVAGDKVLLAPPLFWYYAAGNAVGAAFTHCATLVLQDRFDAAGALDLIERRQCTAIYTLPNMTRAIVDHPSFSRGRTRSLRTGLTIGTPHDVRLAAETLAAPSICNLYGLTETYGNCCVTHSNTTLDYRMSCQGPPLPGFTIRIVDPESGALLPVGSVGVVEVSGYVTPGYSGESAKLNDARTFTADGFFRSGDVGSLDAEGGFHFAGRHTEMIKIGGINVSPAEVEELLQGHADVAQAIAVGVPAEALGEKIVAFVVPRKGSGLTGEALSDYCRGSLSSYKIPAHFMVLESLPTTTTGKISRKDLKEVWAREEARSIAPQPA